MIEGATSQLVLVTFIMFVGAMTCGSLPFWLLSRGLLKESDLSTAGALGGGLLLGSALGVIVPEGFHSFAHVHEHSDHDTHDGDNAAAFGGIALVVGFLFMLFLEQQGIHHHHHSHHQGGVSVSVDDTLAISKTLDAEAQFHKGPAYQHQHQSKEGSAIIGLLVHCAADGLALGAAALAGNATLSFVVGIAMILHKGPMAFGLGAYLLNNGWSWDRAQPTLTAFSAAAPVSAWATFLLLRAIPALTTPGAVALCLLFSGGTFLHAACMHMLPELLQHGSLSFRGQLALAVGAVLPSILSWGHHH